MCWNKRQMLRLVAPQPSNNHKFIINYFSHRIFHSFVRTILWKLAVIEKGPWNGRSKITVRFLFPTKYPKTNQIIEFMVKMAVSENVSKAAVISGPVKISGDFPEKWTWKKQHFDIFPTIHHWLVELVTLEMVTFSFVEIFMTNVVTIRLVSC